MEEAAAAVKDFVHLRWGIASVGDQIEKNLVTLSSKRL